MINKARERLHSRRLAARKLPDRMAIQRYLTALLAQSVLSVFNAGLNIALVRVLAPHDYGTFALCIVFGILGTSINVALTCNPLVVFGTVRLGRPSRRAVEVLLSSVNVAVVAFVFVICVPLVAIFTGEGLLICLLAATSISALTARCYTRSFAYARQRPQIALRGDLTLIIVALLLLFAAVWTRSLSALPSVFLSLTGGNIAAMAVEISSLNLGLRLVQGRSLRRYLAIWKDVRWSLVGSTTTLVQAQAHSFLVSLFFGPAAYAPLAAGQVIFGPVRIMMSAWTFVMQPEVVLAIRNKSHKQILRTLTISAVALASFVVLLGGILALLWPVVYSLLYAGKYSAETMTWVVTAWCAITLATAVGCSPSGVLQTFRKFRTLAFGSVYAAAISTLGVSILVAIAGPEWSLLGILMGEAFLARYMLGHALGAVRKLA